MPSIYMKKFRDGDLAAILNQPVLGATNFRNAPEIHGNPPRITWLKPYSSNQWPAGLLVWWKPCGCGGRCRPGRGGGVGGGGGGGGGIGDGGGDGGLVGSTGTSWSLYHCLGI